MEHPDLYVETLAQSRINRLDLGLRATNQQHFFALQFLQEVGQPIQSRIFGIIRLECREAVCLSITREFFRQGVEYPLIIRGRIERNQSSDSSGKTGDGGAGVAEHHAARAVAVNQCVQ